MDIEAALKDAMSVDGALGVALVDWGSGLSLGSLGSGEDLDLEIAAAGYTEVIRAEMKALQVLHIDDAIEDIMVTTGQQYHLIRLLKRAGSGDGLFFYLALDRARPNPALAWHNLKWIENHLEI